MYFTSPQEHPWTGRLESNLDRAKDVVPFGQRLGSVFVVRELPVVVVGTTIGPVVCAHLDDAEPFGGWSPSRDPRILAVGTPAWHAMNSLGEQGIWVRRPPAPQALVIGKPAWIQGPRNRPVRFEPVPERFQNHVSSPKRKRSRAVMWSVQPVARSGAGVNGVISAFNLANDPAVLVRARKQYEHHFQQFSADWDRIRRLSDAHGERRDDSQVDSRDVHEEYREFWGRWIPGT